MSIKHRQPQVQAPAISRPGSRISPSRRKHTISCAWHTIFLELSRFSKSSRWGSDHVLRTLGRARPQLRRATCQSQGHLDAHTRCLCQTLPYRQLPRRAQLARQSVIVRRACPLSQLSQTQRVRNALIAEGSSHKGRRLSRPCVSSVCMRTHGMRRRRGTHRNMHRHPCFLRKIRRWCTGIHTQCHTRHMGISTGARAPSTEISRKCQVCRFIRTICQASRARLPRSTRQ